MPSPVGHALGGAIVGVLLTPATQRVGVGGPRLARLRHALTPGIVLVGAVAGCAPDVDFAWGRHNMETHSLGAAALAGVVVWTITRNRRLALATVLAWTSHVVFDWLGSDDTPPLGVMALWPLTSTFYFADAFVFDAISRRYWLAEFWAHNLWAVATEALLLGPVLALAAVWRARLADRRG